MKGLPNRFFLMDQQDVFLRAQGFSHGRERRYEKVPTLDITKVIFYYALFRKLYDFQKHLVWWSNMYLKDMSVERYIE